MISELDRKLEEASGMLQLLQGFAMWCDGLPSAQEVPQQSESGDDVQLESSRSIPSGGPVAEGDALIDGACASMGKGRGRFVDVL